MGSYPVVGGTLPNVRGSGGERVCALHLSRLRVGSARRAMSRMAAIRGTSRIGTSRGSKLYTITAAIVSNDGERGLLNEGRTSSTKWNKILLLQPTLVVDTDQKSSPG